MGNGERIPLGEFRLNAPYGARCFLTRITSTPSSVKLPGLNAPYGARCFLTFGMWDLPRTSEGLNAPYGARCFLTGR